MPFLTARCERQSGKTRKRNDLTFLDRNHSIVLTGEVKLPYHKDGGSPLNAAVVRDACTKVRRELDDAVLTMLGVTSAKRRREMIDAMYRYLQEFFTAVNNFRDYCRGEMAR